MIYFDSSTLHALWRIVESHSHFLSTLSDEALTLWLVQHIENSLGIAQDDARALQEYVKQRTCLIRDIVGLQEPERWPDGPSHRSKPLLEAERVFQATSL